MIHLRKAEYPFSQEYRIEIAATTETYRARDRIVQFWPHSQSSAPNVFWGGHDGPGKDPGFLNVFGNMVIEPLPEFAVRAVRFDYKHDQDFDSLARRHGTPSLSLGQVVALSREALNDEHLQPVFGDHLNLFFVHDTKGVIWCVDVLSSFRPTRKYAILGVAPKDTGCCFHRENFMITPDLE
ncbi:MAG: hypothetical protein UT32_C0020G0010 [Parcubacteria group bacterium GW2011_GWC2_39_14]|nr:MAG: hypothetical protein UT32_C0020G0010 [Parcubacteria group bacterium GW2011_GWC2_39_14]KKR54123.1 MAG: hypothetical protein UT91_C0020G0010 [Parcubacteria group bacterium GW2011_GWA2_40_23]